MNDEEIVVIEEENENNVEVEEESIIVANDYEKLDNLPKINDVELKGNKTLDDLDIQQKGDYPNTRVTNAEIDSLFIEGGN